MRTMLLVAAALASAPFAVTGQTAYSNTGRDLAASCAICHGTNGTNAGGMPNLASQPKDQLVLKLREFRDGKRPATIMHQISKGLSEEQIDAVAAYWSAQKAK
jgi:cytochrome subunit of sulfide dehydrogenase